MRHVSGGQEQGRVDVLQTVRTVAGNRHARPGNFLRQRHLQNGSSQGTMQQIAATLDRTSVEVDFDSSYFDLRMSDGNKLCHAIGIAYRRITESEL